MLKSPGLVIIDSVDSAREVKRTFVFYIPTSGQILLNFQMLRQYKIPHVYTRYTQGNTDEAFNNIRYRCVIDVTVERCGGWHEC